VNWWDLDSLGQLWFAAENKIGGKYDDWECTKLISREGTIFVIKVTSSTVSSIFVCFVYSLNNLKMNFEIIVKSVILLLRTNKESLKRE
jgi:hypothetical protein